MTSTEQLDAYTRDDDLRELHAAPRYLAGTGPDLDQVLAPLLAAGFSMLRGNDGEAFLHSPCHRITAAFVPEGDDYGLWHITVAAGSMPGHLPLWKAVFDDGIPAEAVSAFTTALADELAGERRRTCEAGGPGFLFAPFAATPGWYPLGDAGWRSTATAHTVRLNSPDRQAEMVCTRSGLTYAGEMGPGPYAWHLHLGTGRYSQQATFTSGTPTQLVAAFTAALVDPAPAARTARRRGRSRTRCDPAAGRRRVRRRHGRTRRRRTARCPPPQPDSAESPDGHQRDGARAARTLTAASARSGRLRRPDLDQDCAALLTAGKARKAPRRTVWLSGLGAWHTRRPSADGLCSRGPGVRRPEGSAWSGVQGRSPGHATGSTSIARER